MKWTLIGLAACAAQFGCDSSEPIERSEQAESVTVPASAGEPEASIDPRDHPEWEAIVLDAANRYHTEFARVSQIGWIPTMCRAPIVGESRIERDKSHNGLLPDDHDGPGKIGLLFARHAEGYLRDPKGLGASVGQTVVKRAYEAVTIYPETAEDHNVESLIGPPSGKGSPREFFSEHMYTLGELTGLFVMHRLDPETLGTDNGWIYATLERASIDGHLNQHPWRVTAVGRIDSCVGCHQGTGPNRLFGAGDRAVDAPIFLHVSDDSFDDL